MNLKKEMSTTEIEEFLKNKNDFVKIDYLTRFLQEKLMSVTRKFVFLKLGEIYERSSMFTDSGRAFETAGELASEPEKRRLLVKAAQIFARAGDFTRAEGLIRSAVSKASDFDKREIYRGIKEFYLYSAETYEKSRKLGDAIKIYERLLMMEISDSEKKQIKNKLMELYQRLGKIKEYMMLKNSVKD